MATRATFRQIDVSRAVRGMRAAGVDDFKLTLAPDGNIVILAGRSANEAAENSFDRLLGK